MKKILALIMLGTTFLLTGCFSQPDYNQEIDKAEKVVNESNKSTEKIQGLEDKQNESVEELESIIGE